MRALIVAAVSSARQAAEERESIPSQLAQARELCAARGWPIVAEVVIPGHSRDYDWLHEICRDCPEYAALIRQVESGQIDLVVVRDYDRLWRTDALRAQVTALCRQRRVQVFALNQPLEPVNPALLTERSDSRLIIEALSGVVAELENDARRRRAAMGMRARTRRGLHTGKPPWGYRLGPDGIAVIDETTGRWARWIFERRAEGWGYIRIGKALNDLGIPSPMGRLWTIASVYMVLSNPFYRGRVHWGATIAQGLHEPLIDDALAETVASVKRRRAAHQFGRRVYPLSRLCRCARCGWRMTYNPIVGYPYIRCSKYMHYQGRHCVSNMHKAGGVEAYVLAAVQRMLREPELYEVLVEEQGRDGHAHEELAALEAQMRDVAAGWARWDRLFEAGGISADELLMHRQRLHGQRDALSARTDALRAELAASERVAARLREMASVADDLATMAPGEQRNVYADIIDRVELDPDWPEPRIHWL